MPGRHLSVRRKWRDCLCCLSEHVHRARNTSKDKRRFSETWYLSLSFSLAGVCSNFALKTRVCFNPLCLSPLALRSLSLSLFFLTSHMTYDVRDYFPRDPARTSRVYIVRTWWIRRIKGGLSQCKRASRIRDIKIRCFVTCDFSLVMQRTLFQVLPMPETYRPLSDKDL